MHQLFQEIDQFNKWACQESDTNQDQRMGEWECDYRNWDKIYYNFTDFIKANQPANWTKNEKQLLLYIIARDNESERLSEILSESDEGLLTLAKEATHSKYRDAKWQLAVQLHKLIDKSAAHSLLETFVKDDDEYVNRRALMELAKLQSNKVEFYCEKFWNKDKYAEMEEYQRMAVLHSLKIVNSKLLPQYLKLAKLDGRKYLVEQAQKLEED